MSKCLSVVRRQHSECICARAHVYFGKANSLHVRYFAVCHIMLWNRCCCCCMSKEVNSGGNFVIHRMLLEQCVDVLTERESLHLQERESEGKRGERACLTVQSVMKCTASKPIIASGNRSHFPNHIHASIIYFHSLALISFSLSLSLLQCWGCLSLYLISAFVQSSPSYVAGCSVNAKPANCDLQGAQRSQR